MESGLVSIIMPAFNAGEYIGQAIDSVLSQVYKHWELIVVDDGSTDDTAAITASFADTRIRLIRQTNGGESSARNTAIENVDGEYFAFLDADDIFLPDHLQVAVEQLQRCPDYGGVYSDGYYCDVSGRRLQTLSSRRRGPFSGRVFDEVVRSTDVFGPPVCVLLRTEPIMVHRLRFDENITIGPDWVFLMEYADVARFKYIDKCTCLYRLHQTNITLRVGLEKMALELAKCRIRSVKMDGFNTCPLDVRVSVFYDLLVNLLRNLPDEQMEVTQWKEFSDLPTNEQARLLRLMSSSAMAYGTGSESYISVWLERAQDLCPEDRTGVILSRIYRISPGLCSALVKAKYWGRSDPLDLPPFADMADATA